MELSYFLAKFFGIYLIIISIFLFSRQHVIQETFDNFFRNIGLLVYSGAMLMALGLLIVLSHNVWELSWRSIITVFGYIILLKGLIRVFFPNWGRDLVFKFINGNWPKYIGALMLLLGVYLTIKGFSQ